MGKNAGENPISTARVKGLSTTKITKGTKKMTYQNQPPRVIDLNTLQGESVNERVVARGVELVKKGRVHQNSLYPWRFNVSGDQGETGATLYVVDLSTYECSCLWYLNTHSTCKHLVAALLTHMEKEPVLV
jgi:uncharacterized Zn finger protein